MARDWMMSVDLERPQKNYNTQHSKMRPDMILALEDKNSKTTRLPGTDSSHVGEDGGGAREKQEKHQELVEDCRKNGWKTRGMPVEVGSLGFVSYYLSKAYSTLGITGAIRRRAIDNHEKKKPPNGSD